MRVGSEYNGEAMAKCNQRRPTYQISADIIDHDELLIEFVDLYFQPTINEPLMTSLNAARHITFISS